MMDIKERLQQLTQARGPSGGEADVARLVAAQLAPFCQKVTVDAMGNVLGFKPGQGPEPRPRVMLMAHMDEIHLTVSAIDGAFLRFLFHGYDPRVLVGAEVTVMAKRPLHGVIGDLPPHLMTQQDRQRMPNPEALVIDVGLSAEEVAELVSIGDTVVLEGPFLELLGDRVASKALDNRLLVATMIATLEELTRVEHACDILAVASVNEEFNGLGAKTATYAHRPDLAIALDVTFGRQPGVRAEDALPLGSGPAIGMGPNMHPILTQTLLETAESLEIPHEVEVLPASTGTDAWHIQVAAGGVPTGLVSIPIRNMHSPVEVVDLKDVRRAVRLLAAFLARLDADFLSRLTYSLPDLQEAAS